MSFEDVVNHFHTINVCLVRHAALDQDKPFWNESRKKFSYHFSKSTEGVVSVSMFKLKIKEKGSEVFATVHQPYKRRIGSLNYIDIGVVIPKEVVVQGRRDFVVMGSSHNTVSRQNQLEMNPGTLDVGTYIVVLTSTGCLVENELRIMPSDLLGIIYDRPCVMSIHCDAKFSFEEMAFDMGTYKAATILPVKLQGDKKDLLQDGGVILYTQCNGFAGNSYCVENRKKDMYCKLNMDFSESINVMTEDGLLTSEIIVAPGDCKIVHHIMPANMNEGWSCKWGCSGAFLTREQFEDGKASACDVGKKEEQESVVESGDCVEIQGSAQIVVDTERTEEFVDVSLSGDNYDNDVDMYGDSNINTEINSLSMNDGSKELETAQFAVHGWKSGDNSLHSGQFHQNPENHGEILELNNSNDSDEDSEPETQVYEHTIEGKDYFIAGQEDSSAIFEKRTEDEVGDQVGEYQLGYPIFYSENERRERNDNKNKSKDRKRAGEGDKGRILPISVPKGCGCIHVFSKGTNKSSCVMS